MTTKNDHDFDRAAELLQEKILAACEPGEDQNIEGPRFIYLLGAVFSRLACMQVSFMAEHGEPDVARQIVEACEADLIDLRKKFGWLSDQ
jgi:hypothetical protein